MRVEIKQTADAAEPYAVIYCREIDKEVLTAAEMFKRGSGFVTVYDRGQIVVIKREDIFMIRTEEGRTRIYSENADYETSNPLRDHEAFPGFMRISKYCIINLEQIKCFEPLLSGTMQVTLKNGLKDYISRKYLPDMKRYLGL